MSIATQRREIARLRFEVPGRCPSKANFRYGLKSREQWREIKRYEEEVGIEALRAGAGPLRREHGANPVGVELVAFGQRCDLDNLAKVLLDGLEGVAFCNDRQVVATRSEKFPDDGKHARVRITVVYFEGDQ